MLYDGRHNDVRRSPTVITADDGRDLAGTWFAPVSGDARGVVVIGSAMATPASYYAPFATWLATQGYRTLTSDVRGTESVAAMKAEDADLLRWFGDIADAVDHALEQADGQAGGPAGGLPVSYVGHSMGGQAVPLLDHSRLTRIVTVASGTGYYRHNLPAFRWGVPFARYVVEPAATRVAGYFPGRRLRILGDVPTGVMRQWGRWCMSPDFLGVDVPNAEERFASVTTPITSLTFTDDRLLSEANAADLLDRFVHADQVRQRYSPEQLEVEYMGHHGFFRARHQDLWDELVLPYLGGFEARR